MVAEEELRSRRGETNPGAPNGNDLGATEVDSLFAHTRTELTNLFGSLRRTAFVEWQGLQLRAIDVAFRGALFFCAGVFGLAALVFAARFLVSGIRGAIQAMGGAVWVSDLGAAVVVLLLVFPGAFAVRAMVRKKVVKKVERALAARATPDSKPAPEAPHEFGRAKDR
jgi:hypothetical protein